MPLLYEEKEFIHQEEIMYTVFILGLRKRNLNSSPTCSLILGKHTTIDCGGRRAFEGCRYRGYSSFTAEKRHE